MARVTTEDAVGGCGKSPEEPATSKCEYLIGWAEDNMCLSNPETCREREKEKTGLKIAANYLTTSSSRHTLFIPSRLLNISLQPARSIGWQFAIFSAQSKLTSRRQKIITFNNIELKCLTGFICLRQCILSACQMHTKQYQTSNRKNK